MDIKIDREEVYRYLGYRAGDHVLTGEMQDLVEHCIAEVLRTITPRTIYAGPLILEETDGTLKAENMLLRGNDIRAHLKGCDSVVMLAVTLGGQIDVRLRQIGITDMTKSVIMDSVCNVAVEQLADEMEDKIRAELRTEGKYLTSRYSPGYGDMPLDSQRALLAVTDAERKIGITLTPTNLMIPRKSITAIMGVADVPVTGKRAGCEHCAMRDKCLYRKRGTTCGEK